MANFIFGAFCCLFFFTFLHPALADVSSAYLAFKNNLEGSAEVTVDGKNSFRMLTGVSLASYQPEDLDYCEPMIYVRLEGTSEELHFQWDLTKLYDDVLSVASSVKSHPSLKNSQSEIPITTIVVLSDNIIHTFSASRFFKAKYELDDSLNVIITTPQTEVVVNDSLYEMGRLCAALR